MCRPYLDPDLADKLGLSVCVYVRANAYKHLCIFMWRMWDFFKTVSGKIKYQWNI